MRISNDQPLSMINDQISEEDIRNVKVPGNKIKKQKKVDATPAKVKIDPPKEEGESPQITTWNILEE